MAFRLASQLASDRALHRPHGHSVDYAGVFPCWGTLRPRSPQMSCAAAWPRAGPFWGCPSPQAFTPCSLRRSTGAHVLGVVRPYSAWLVRAACRNIPPRRERPWCHPSGARHRSAGRYTMVRTGVPYRPMVSYDKWYVFLRVVLGLRVRRGENNSLPLSCCFVKHNYPCVTGFWALSVRFLDVCAPGGGGTGGHTPRARSSWYHKLNALYKPPLRERPVQALSRGLRRVGASHRATPGGHRWVNQCVRVRGSCKKGPLDHRVGVPSHSDRTQQFFGPDAGGPRSCG